MPTPPPQRRVDSAAISTPWNTIAQELFRADGLTLTASGDTVTNNVPNQVSGALGSGYVDVSAVQSGLLMVNVPSAPTGTTPSLSLFFDVQDYWGNWYQASGALPISGAAITAAGVYAGNISSSLALPLNGRIRWTISGTTPQFKVSLSLYGR